MSLSEEICFFPLLSVHPRHNALSVKSFSFTLRLGADVLAWLNRSGPGYQTRINALLRQAMHRPRPASRRPVHSPTKKSR